MKQTKKQQKLQAERDAMAMWLAERGGKFQEYGGKYSFFGPRERMCPLLWVDVDTDGDVSVALVDEENRSLHHWIGKRTREQIEQLMPLLGVVTYRPTDATL